jgi:hypothetical protein
VSQGKTLPVLAIGLVLACLAGVYIWRSSPKAAWSDPYQSWELDAYFAFPVWVALNRVASPELGLREMYLFVEARDFTEENLTTVFTSLSERYPKPETLLVLALSDRERLQRFVVDRQIPGPIDHQTRLDQPIQVPIMEQTGFYRALFERREGAWYYSYSPEPASKELHKVILRERRIHYTGNVDSDLVLAATEGDCPTLERLLQAGANVNSRNSRGDTALCEAIGGDSADCIRALLAAGADVNQKRGEGGDPPLMIAASGEDRDDRVKALLERGAHANARNDYGDSALIRASYYGYVKAVRILLHHGAKVDLKNNRGWTALMSAAANGYSDIVAALIAAGADVRLANKDGNTAADLATRGEQRDRIIQMLRR